MPINLKDLEDTLLNDNNEDNIKIDTVSNNDIAIIGLSCRIGKSNNKEEYWESLRSGEDNVRSIPSNRKGFIENYFKAKGIIIGENDYQEEAFLKEIDKFDYELFSISPLEASLMSPNQRIFLETAWSTIEDAGYGGKKISSSKTGVFLGHTTDFGISYKRYVETLNEELAGLSMSGNLNSIIASRIAYLLDLKGPSMLVDTACSSSLSAVHLACQSLRNNECEMALAGAVRVDLSPVLNMQKVEDIGIASSNKRTKTFDDSSDGTGDGEGVGAILLKPLYKALEDGDNIYAIIKGSAMNQDGRSVGMTAPNPDAQKELLLEAWKNADIDPETISYIEAHGTGTRLGDPIEVSGIERAFRECTNKKQFCGIGSVKTNIGHLDCAAGIAGIIKLILSLKNGEIPPSINFKKPNRKINFEDSPVYVNDKLRKWVSLNSPRRGGVSAFGLSGTNCHIVLEEPPLRDVYYYDDDIRKKKVFTLSAKNKQVLVELIRKYQVFLYKHYNMNINNLCYTLNTGRGHYNHRLAIVFNDTKELKMKLEKLYISELSEASIESESGVFYGEYRIVSEKQKSRAEGEITAEHQLEATNMANNVIKKYLSNNKEYDEDKLDELCKLYICGSEIDWEYYYREQNNIKVSLPTYPFQKKSCWVEKSVKTKEISYIGKENLKHPLFEMCLAESFDRITFLSKFDVANYWVLNEHHVAGVCVIPGTTYLEMVTEFMRTRYPEKVIHLKDVLFITPLAVEENEIREVHTVINYVDDFFEFIIASKAESSGEWIKHVEGKVLFSEEQMEEKINIENIKKQCSGRQLMEYSYNPEYSIELGPRWNCLGDTYVGENEILGYLSLNENFNEDLNIYNLHPALLDEAVNVAIRTIGQGIYLPFSYKDLKIFGNLPREIYSYVRKINESQKNQEFASFDVTLMDKHGNILITAKDYKVKRVDESKMMLGANSNYNPYYNFVWEEKTAKTYSKNNIGDYTLVLKGKGEKSSKICESIKNNGGKIIEVEIGSEFKVFGGNNYSINCTENDYRTLFQNIKNKSIGKIIYLNTLTDENEIESIEQFEDKQRRGVYSLFNLIRALVEKRYERTIDIIVVAQYGNQVNNSEEYIEPLNSSLFGLGKVINIEYPKLRCRCVDIDNTTDIGIIKTELWLDYEEYMVAYRNGKRFVPRLDEINMDKVDVNSVEIINDGIYIITGGTGGIGLEVARFLSSKANVNIALINRSEFPSENTWKDILHKNEDEKLCNKIKNLIEIKQSGSNVVLYKGNISNICEMKEIIDDLKKRYTNINGIFHAAGVAGNGFVINRKKEDFESVILPKTKGTWILNKLTEKMNLDFFVLFSSISSFVIEHGQGDYIAANCYLDAFSTYGKKLGRRMITINWPAWQEIGMAVDYGVNMKGDLFNPIKTQKAIKALDDIINKNIQNVIVGELNSDYSLNDANQLTIELFGRIKSKIGVRNATVELKPKNSARKSVSVNNVELRGKENKNQYTELEIKIGNILGTVLGLNEINIYDSFLEIGGNSLLAVRIEVEMERQGIPISVIDLYEYSSVKELGEFIENKLHRKEFKDESHSVVFDESVEVHEENNNQILLDKIEPFNGIMYKSCFHNAIIPIVRFYNKNNLNILACNDVFAFEFDSDTNIGQARINDIFNKTLKQMFEGMNIKIDTKTHITNINKEFTPSEDEMFKLDRVSQYIGIARNQESEDIGGLIKHITTALSKGRFVCIWVDCFYESIRRDTYNKEHLMHTLLLYGYDDVEQKFYTLEHSHRDNLNYKKQMISYEDVINSYKGYIANYLNYSNFPTFYEFYQDNNGHILPDINYKNIFKDNVYANREKIEFGINNLKLFLDRLNIIIQDENILEKNVDNVISVLNKIINDKQLERFNIITLFEDKLSIIDKITEVINSWNYVRQVIVKYMFSNIYDSIRIQSVLNILPGIFETEMSYQKELQALLNSIE